MESNNDAIWKRAKFLGRNFNRDEIQSITLLIMYDLGMPLNYSGFGYLKHAISVAFNSPYNVGIIQLLAACDLVANLLRTGKIY